MFRKLSHALLIAALVSAVGGHWALLQTVAWTNMLAANLRTNSFEQAVAKTFDGQHPCKLCKVIAAGKQAERKSELSVAAKKLEFITDAGRFIFASPDAYWLLAEFQPKARSIFRTPPLPPPRSHAV